MIHQTTLSNLLNRIINQPNLLIAISRPKRRRPKIRTAISHSIFGEVKHGVKFDPLAFVWETRVGAVVAVVDVGACGAGAVVDVGVIFIAGASGEGLARGYLLRGGVVDKGVGTVVGGLEVRWDYACCGEAEDGSESEELFCVRVFSRMHC